MFDIECPTFTRQSPASVGSFLNNIRATYITDLWLACILQSARATSLFLSDHHQRYELSIWLDFRHKENNLKKNNKEEKNISSICISNYAKQ